MATDRTHVVEMTEAFAAALDRTHLEGDGDLSPREAEFYRQGFALGKQAAKALLRAWIEVPDGMTPDLDWWRRRLTEHGLDIERLEPKK